MLLQLSISNFAIIEQVNIKFGSGFNVISGETGAGKSILVEALQLVLGGRGNKSFIREGEDMSRVEAVFFTTNPNVSKKLEEAGIEEDETLIISRELSRNGPSVCRINNRIVTVSFLNEIGRELVDLVLQNENKALMHSNEQRNLLDQFIGKSQAETMNELSILMDEINKLESQIKKEDQDPSARAREIDLLKFQINEIETVNLVEGEDEQIKEELKQLENSTLIAKNLYAIYEMITGDHGTSSILTQITNLLYEIKDYNIIYEEWFESFNNFSYEISDLGRNIFNYMENLSIDEAHLQKLNQRYDEINRVKRKYGQSYTDYMLFYENACERLNYLENFEEALEKKNNKIENLYKEAYKKAHKLHKARHEMSKFLEQKIVKELLDLDIKNAKFKIVLEEQPLDRSGIDQVTYYIATNKGERLYPMAQIASGGEMSRIMLGFKSIMAQYEDLDTLVFDEIDIGISGRTAQVVAEKLINLSKSHQLVVISHLPQIVASGEEQFQIKKDVYNGRTQSTVTKLNYKERIDSLAIMISGRDITEKSRQTAIEMLGKV